MAIIESVLQKAKQAQGKSGREAQRIPPQVRRQEGPRVGDVAAAPATGIQGHPFAVDPRALREQHVLLGKNAADRGLVAAYGMLRTRLLHRVAARGWTTLGITSPAPNDGKTLTAINLALSLARQSSHIVFLLDLDMSNPSVLPTFGITPPLELREHFAQASGGGVSDALFCSIGVPNLLIAGSTHPSEQSAELLASRRLEELTDHLKNSTSGNPPLILIDLPPLLATDDALVVAPRIDALVVVASEGSTSRDDLHKALDLVGEFPIAGLVMNRARGRNRRYAYGYGGYGGYGASEAPAPGAGGRVKTAIGLG